MAPVIPGRGRGNGKPKGDEDQLGVLGPRLFNMVVMKPLSRLLAMVLGEEPEDWDTVEELGDNLVPALIRLPLRILVSLIGGIPIIGDAVEDALAGWLKTTNETAVDAAETVVSVGTQVNYVQQVIAVQSGMGVWETGPDRTGTPSFAFGYLNLHSHTASLTGTSGGTHSHNVTGNTSNATAAGDSHLHGAGSLSAGVTGSGHSHTGSVVVDNMDVPIVNATAAFAPWANVIFKSAAERKVITFLAYKTGTVSAFYLDVYKLEADGSSTLLYSSPNLAGELAGILGWQQHLMDQTIVADMGDSYDVQFRMVGSGSVSIAGINLPNPTPLPGFRPYTAGSGRNPSGTPAPSTISTSTRDTMYTGPTPWVSIGIDVGQTTLPRFFFDDFNRTSFGARWITYGQIEIESGRVQHSGGIFDSNTAAAMYTQPLISDTVRVAFDALSDDELVGGAICAASGLGAGAWLTVNDAGAYIQSGSYATRTTRATGVGGSGYYILTYTASDNTFRAYKGSESNPPIATWVDSSHVVTHGTGRRWVGVLARRNFLDVSGRLDNFTAGDVTA